MRMAEVRMPDDDSAPKKSAPIPGRLEREETQLWRWALGLIVLLAAALAYFSWEQLKNLPYKLWAIPAGLFILSFLFATYAFGRKREVTDLKQLLRGLEERSGAAPTEAQLDHLGQLISRSQRNFKELIDSLDDVALAVSLDGTLRTVNRRVTEILGSPYTTVLGHKLTDFLSAPPVTETAFDLSRFLEKRTWTGGVAIQVKSDQLGPGKRLYYDCMVHAIVKGDDVTGASVLARNITDQRDKEQRFTQLFESLREGVYICSPEGKLFEVNPALVTMLGYESKEELLNLPPDALKVTASPDPALGRAGSQSGRTR